MSGVLTSAIMVVHAAITLPSTAVTLPSTAVSFASQAAHCYLLIDPFICNMQFSFSFRES
jgi:hypothetical protein